MLQNVRLPEWFRLETGFTYLDNGECPCVIIGAGLYVEHIPMGEISLHKDPYENHGIYEVENKPGIWVACGYKGCFIMCDLQDTDYDQEYFDKCRPLEVDDNTMLNLTGKYIFSLQNNKVS